ncbi:TPA: Ig-like domain-containing protein [Pseudomonas aeruginosa]
MQNPEGDLKDMALATWWRYPATALRSARLTGKSNLQHGHTKEAGRLHLRVHLKAFLNYVMLLPTVFLLLGLVAQVARGATTVEPTYLSVTFADGSTTANVRPGETISVVVKYQENVAGKLIRGFTTMGWSQSSSITVSGTTNQIFESDTNSLTPVMPHDCRINTNSPCTNFSSVNTYTGTFVIDRDMMTKEMQILDWNTFQMITVPPQPIPYGEHQIIVSPGIGCNALGAAPPGSLIQPCAVEINLTKYLTVNILPDNTAPIVSDRSATTLEDTQVAIPLSVIDPDVGDFASYTIVTAPDAQHGSAVIAGNQLIFKPRQDWNGVTSLTYRATDSRGATSNIATVTITVTPVNDPPVAHDKSLTIDEDTSGSVTLSATDIDSPSPSVFQIVSPPNAAHGSASIVGSTLTFTPVENWNGTTSLTYRAQDSSGAWSAPATVSITVRPVNDAPAVSARNLITPEDTSATLTLTAADVDSSVFIFEIVSPPANGVASVSGSTLTFTLASDWNGVTSLTYRAKDDAGAWSNVATITITVSPVNDPPVAQPLTLEIDEDSPGSVPLQATDIDSVQTFSFEIVGNAATDAGVAQVQGNQLNFTPAANWNGSTTLSYRARDVEGAWSLPAQVTVKVRPINDEPTPATAIHITTLESKPKTQNVKVSN